MLHEMMKLNKRWGRKGIEKDLQKCVSRHVSLDDLIHPEYVNEAF